MWLVSASRRHRELPSFPTRRSSDLDRRGGRDDEEGRRSGSARGRRRTEPSQGDGASRQRSDREPRAVRAQLCPLRRALDRKSTRLNSSHLVISYAVFCLQKKSDKK